MRNSGIHTDVAEGTCLVVSTSECNAEGSSIEPALQTVSVFFFSRKSLRYAAFGTGCTRFCA